MGRAGNLAWCLVLAAAAGCRGATDAERVAALDVPRGFQIALYLPAPVPSARGMTVSGASATTGPIITYIGSRNARTIYALVDRDRNGTADSKVNVIQGIDTPTGVAWRAPSSLFVSGFQDGKGLIWRYDGVDAAALAGKALTKPAAVVTSSLPGDDWHGLRFMRFGPDGLLYIGIGAPCNVCSQESYRGKAEGSPAIPYGSIVTLDVDSGKIETYATGIRNTVGFDWHPTRRGFRGQPLMFFTDNGRDSIGDDVPDDELNVADRRGLFFGFPYCHTVGLGNPYQRSAGRASVLADPSLNANNRTFACNGTNRFKAAIQPMGPHVAALGMRFYTGNMFPAAYNGTILIAQRGSWDRSVKIGYRVMAVRLDPATLRPTSFEPFATGWLAGGAKPTADSTAWGRPVDVQQLPDGSVLVTDDNASRVYRISYTA